MKYRAFIDRSSHELVIVGYAPAPFTTMSFREWADKKAIELHMYGWSWIEGDGATGKTDRAILDRWEEIWLDVTEK